MALRDFEDDRSATSLDEAAEMVNEQIDNRYTGLAPASIAEPNFALDVMAGSTPANTWLARVIALGRRR